MSAAAFSFVAMSLLTAFSSLRTGLALRAFPAAPFGAAVPLPYANVWADEVAVSLAADALSVPARTAPPIPPAASSPTTQAALRPRRVGATVRAGQPVLVLP